MDEENLLRTYINEVSNKFHSGYGKLITKWVQEPNKITIDERKKLALLAMKTSLEGGSRLMRVARSDPKWHKGAIINFDVATSFSEKDLSKEHAGVIAWKSSDESLIVIESPRRGLRIDYNLPGISKNFISINEMEVLIGGTYHVTQKEKWTEPFTNPNYDYNIPVYILKES